MIKRLLSLLLVTVLLLTAVLSCGCDLSDTKPVSGTDQSDKTDKTDKTEDTQEQGKTDETDTPVVPVTYSAPLSFNETLSMTCNTWTTFTAEKSWAFNDEDFIGANDTFNKDLAFTSLLFLMVESGGTFSVNGNAVNVYEMMGLSAFERVTMTTSTFTVDINDIEEMTLAQKTFTTADGTSYQLITAALNPGYEVPGWRSNFDVGADTQAYIDATGNESPDWIDKKEHKGFSVTAERVAQYIETYAANHQAEGTKTIVFITGQSRGGAVANIAAKHLIDRGVNTIAYGFNVPNTTTENDQTVLSSYKTIYNIINQDDIVSDVPLAAWGFTRCGQDVVYSIAQDPTAWETLFGATYAYPDSEYVAPVVSFLLSLAPTREALYEYIDDPEVVASQILPVVLGPEADEATIESTLQLFMPTNAAAARMVKITVEKNESSYGFFYAIRPALVTVPLADAIGGLLNGSSSTMVLMAVMPYYTFLSSYTDVLTGAVTTIQSDTTLMSRFLYSHVFYTNFVGLDQLK